MLPAVVKACIDRALPDELMQASMQRAVEENATNAPAINRRMLPPGVQPDVPRLFLAAITGKLWQPGRTLRVRFLDGDPQVHERIPPFAQLWSQYANLNFAFTDDADAEIRISFQNQGSWSYVGTDALVIPLGQPTMNFGWLTRATPNDEYGRVVTHEFGHALGFIHEHQNPATDIPWDKEAVYSFYAGPPNFWTREQVDVNLFTRYSADITQFSDFDPASIMLYPIPNEFTIGDFEVGWNKEPSATDKRFSASVYPIESRQTNDIVVDDLPVEASIGHFGEIDTFAFAAPAPGAYRLETQGNTDLVMSLFGPNTTTLPIAIDDGSAHRGSARIVATLRPGYYTVRIRHCSPVGVGHYRIGVYSAHNKSANGPG